MEEVYNILHKLGMDVCKTLTGEHIIESGDIVINNSWSGSYKVIQQIEFDYLMVEELGTNNQHIASEADFIWIPQLRDLFHIASSLGVVTISQKDSQYCVSIDSRNGRAFGKHEQLIYAICKAIKYGVRR